MIRPFISAVVLTIAGIIAIPSLARAEAQVVNNPATPVGGTSVLAAEEMFSLGGESDLDEEFFGVVRSAVVDDAGNTYLLDEQLSEVRVFDTEGNYIMTFGREGEGPGEFRFARKIIRMPDDGIAVMHGRPAKLTRFGFDGSIGDNMYPGGDESMGFIENILTAGDKMAMLRHSFSMGEKTSTSTKKLASLNADGSIDHVYLEDSQEMALRGRGGMRISIDGSFVNEWTFGADGRMYVNRPTDAYEIEVYAPDGTLERTIMRDYEPVRRTDQEIANFTRQAEETGARFGNDTVGNTDFEFRNVISDLIVRPNGELWVLTGEGAYGRDAQNTNLGTFDVFDAEGRFTRQVMIDIPFERTDDTYAFVGDRLFIFDEAMDALQAMGRGRGMIIMSGDDEEDDSDPEPLSITCYSLGE